MLLTCICHFSGDDNKPCSGVGVCRCGQCHCHLRQVSYDFIYSRVKKKKKKVS